MTMNQRKIHIETKNSYSINRLLRRRLIDCKKNAFADIQIAITLNRQTSDDNSPTLTSNHNVSNDYLRSPTTKTGQLLVQQRTRPGGPTRNSLPVLVFLYRHCRCGDLISMMYVCPALVGAWPPIMGCRRFCRHQRFLWADEFPPGDHLGG